MKEIKRNVVTATVVTEYESSDGCVFKSKEECEKWERDIVTCFMKIPQIRIVGEKSYLPEACEGETVVILTPRNLTDIATINRYGRNNIGSSLKEFTPDLIDKTVIINIGCDNDCFYWYEMDSYLIEIIRTYNNYKNKVNAIAREKEVANVC